ncbi:anti-phage Hailong system effector protein HalA [Serratia fonticola]
MTARRHRISNYWDVIYNPLIELNDFVNISFDDLKHNTGPSLGLFDLSTINEKIKTFESINFNECDIYGELSAIKLNFKECRFKKVYFGYSVFKNTKFQNCTFEKCSLAMTKFENCQFIDCKFTDISFSGNETIFENTQINSEMLIKAGYTNLDESVLKEKGVTAEYQSSRFETTKAKMARMILNSLSSTADDDLYYNSVKTYLISRTRARIYKYKYAAGSENGFFKRLKSRVKMVATKFELLILCVSGTVNNWGNGLFRAVMVGLLLILAFCLYYHNYFGTTAIGSLIKSIDITFLAGYTKHVTKETATPQQCVMLLNMCLGLWWYAIIIPTLINRICSTRQ